MRKVLLAHSGKQHSYRTAKALQDNGFLERFFTSGYVNNAVAQSLVHQFHVSFLEKRMEAGLDPKKVLANWGMEWKENLLRLKKASPLAVQKAILERDQAFDKQLSKRIAKMPGDVFWGFQGSCLHTLKAANKAGKATICEQASVHVSAIHKAKLEVEAHFAEWTWSCLTAQYPADYSERLDQEAQEAQTVLAASTYTKSTLEHAGIHPKKIKVLPLNADLEGIRPKEKVSSMHTLRVLFIGRLSALKGFHLFAQAANMAARERLPFEFTAIGSMMGESEKYEKLAPHVHLKTAVPRKELLAAIKEYDVLVLPTLFDGFGLVLAEAWAAGLPVIASPRSMAPDFLVHGENGFLMQELSAEHILKLLLDYNILNLEEKEEIRTNCLATSNAFTFQAFASRVKVLVEGLF